MSSSDATHITETHAEPTINQLFLSGFQSDTPVLHSQTIPGTKFRVIWSPCRFFDGTSCVGRSQLCSSRVQVFPVPSDHTDHRRRVCPDFSFTSEMCTTTISRTLWTCNDQHLNSIGIQVFNVKHGLDMAVSENHVATVMKQPTEYSSTKHTASPTSTACVPAIASEPDWLNRNPRTSEPPRSRPARRGQEPSEPDTH